MERQTMLGHIAARSKRPRRGERHGLTLFDLSHNRLLENMRQIDVKRRARPTNMACEIDFPVPGRGLRRWACDPSLRARLFRAAPPPEGAGGSPRARHDRGDAQADGRSGRRGRARGELRRRGVLMSGAAVDLYTEVDAIRLNVFRPKVPPLGPIDPRAFDVKMRAWAVDPLPSDEPGGRDVVRQRKLHAKVV